MKVRDVLIVTLVAILLGAYLSELAAEGVLPGAVNIRTSPKGTTAAGSPTSTSVDANTQGLDVSVKGTVPVSGTFWQTTQPVSGTFWQATQPVSGTFWQTTQPVSIAALTSIVTGQQAVTATAAALPTNAGKSVCVQALSANGIDVYLGPSTVTTANGWPLTPGSGDCFTLDNSNRLYVIGSTTGSSVAFRVLN